MLRKIQKKATIVVVKNVRRIKFRMKLNKSCRDYNKVCKKVLAGRKVSSEEEKLRIVLTSDEYFQWEKKHPVNVINAMRA